MQAIPGPPDPDDPTPQPDSTPGNPGPGNSGPDKSGPRHSPHASSADPVWPSTMRRTVCYLTDAELLDELDTLQRLTDAIAARQLELIRDAEVRGLPRAHGAANTACWLRDRSRVSLRTARTVTKLASTLDKHPTTAAALAASEVNLEQATVITDTLDQLPPELSLAQREKAEQMLLGFSRFEPRNLRRLGDRILTYLAPEIAEAAEAKALARAEKKAYQTRTLSIVTQDDGRVRVTGWLTHDMAAILQAALDPLVNPGHRLPHPTAPATSPGESSAATGSVAGQPETITPPSGTTVVAGETVVGEQRSARQPGTPARASPRQHLPARALHQAQRAERGEWTDREERARMAETIRPLNAAVTIEAHKTAQAWAGHKLQQTLDQMAATAQDPANQPTAITAAEQVTADMASLPPAPAAVMKHENGTWQPTELDGVKDQRTIGQRRADALIELCKLALHTAALPANGGDRPQVVVTMDFQQLAEQIGAGTLDNGYTVTPQTARKLACDADIIPAILGGKGQVLDLGRTRRLITGALRRALVIRDKGCTFPGCDRPARWSEGHHAVSWLDGGPTSLNNSVLVCQHHHTTVHQGHWKVRIADDGLPEWIPPFFVDPLQRSMRNIYWREPTANGLP